MSGLFGGPQQSGTTTTNSTSQPWSAQQPYLQGGFQSANNWYNNGGSQVAPLNQNQLTGMNNTMNYAGSGANGLLPSSTNSLNSFMNGSMINSNPYLNQMANSANNATIRQYQNAVAPGISSNFEANGRYGSGAMANAQSQAQQDLATQLGNTNANIYGNAYQQGTQQMLQANALAPMTANMGLGLTSAQTAVGNQQQAQQQNVNNQPMTNLQNYMNVVGGQGYGGATSQTQPYFTNPTANTLGTAMGLYSLYSMFSDRRLKDNIEKVGKLDNGLNIYSYNYKGDPKTTIGVMADEVKKVNPQAVRSNLGFDMVNYGEAVK